MPDLFPPDIEQFVQQELASQEYQSRDDLIVDAVRVLRELKTRHQKLRDDVRHSIAQAERGEVRPLDTDATKAAARDRLSKQVTARPTRGCRA